MTELSPYQRELRQDLIDYEVMRAGLDAYQRISAVPAEDALVHLATAATPEQRERVLKRCERGEEFYRLPDELQTRLREVA
jgi:DNA polymerase II large subunit